MFPGDDAGATERYTTWSNMVRQQRQETIGGGGGGGADTRGRARTREENNINNNMDTNRKSRWAQHGQMSPGTLHLIRPAAAPRNPEIFMKMSISF